MDAIVEVFKTNVTQKQHATRLIQQLHVAFPEYQINFDLEDCDRILRVQSDNGDIDVDHIMLTLQQTGFTCDILDT